MIIHKLPVTFFKQHLRYIAVVLGLAMFLSVVLLGYVKSLNSIFVFIITWVPTIVGFYFLSKEFGWGKVNPFSIKNWGRASLNLYWKPQFKLIKLSFLGGLALSLFYFLLMFIGKTPLLNTSLFWTMLTFTLFSTFWAVLVPLLTYPFVVIFVLVKAVFGKKEESSLTYLIDLPTIVILLFLLLLAVMSLSS